MKQKLFYILALAAGLGLHSCDSLFDNELPKHDLVGDNAIVDEKSAETALNGVYSYLDDSRYTGSTYKSESSIGITKRFPRLYLDPAWLQREKS